MAKMVVYRLGREPQIEEVKDLSQIQEICGGYFEGVSFGPADLMIYCNDEGKLRGLPAVAAVPSLQDVICGDFVVTRGDDEGNDVDVSERDLETCRGFIQVVPSA